MAHSTDQKAGALRAVVWATGEAPAFAKGERVRVLRRSPIGHYRVPVYLRGLEAEVEQVVEPAAVNNEEEGFGRNAGARRHYYRIGLPLSRVWQVYAGPAHDTLRIEVFESWLEKAE